LNCHFNLKKTVRVTLKKVGFFTLFGIGVFLNWGHISFLNAQGHSDEKNSSHCIVGTYLIEEGSGTRGLWEFSKEGNFTGTSSAQPLLNFSTLQGVWKSVRGGAAKATVLDFSFDDQGNLINIARVDIRIRGAGKKCQTLEGEFVLRFFEEGEDPLQPPTDTGDPYMDLFTGQRITVD
jgi:hypothetical protein